MPALTAQKIHASERALNPGVRFIDFLGMTDNGGQLQLFPGEYYTFVLRQDNLLALGVKKFKYTKSQFPHMFLHEQLLPPDYYGGHPTLAVTFDRQKEDPTSDDLCHDPVKYAGWITLKRDTLGKHYFEVLIDSGRYKNFTYTTKQIKQIEQTIARCLTSACCEEIDVIFTSRITKEDQLCYFIAERQQRTHPINRIFRYSDVIDATPFDSAAILYAAIRYNNYAVIEECLARGIAYEGANDDLPNLQQAVQYGLLNVTRFKLYYNTYNQKELNDALALAKTLDDKTIYHLLLQHGGHDLQTDVAPIAPSAPLRTLGRK